MTLDTSELWCFKSTEAFADATSDDLGEVSSTGDRRWVARDRGGSPNAEQGAWAMNVYAPIKGKCVWWREFPNEEDRWDSQLRVEQKRVECICFVEGDMWEYRRLDLPGDCPVSRKCRYHVLAG